MDKTLIGKKLQELRFSKFGKDQSMGDFEAISGVSRGSVGPIEKGMSFPRLDILQKWTTACGTTPSKFLEDLQKEIGTNQDVEIVPGFEAFYDNLTRIIRSGSQFYIKGIEANLKSLATTAEQETGESTRAERGNVNPKERKRTRKAG